MQTTLFTRNESYYKVLETLPESRAKVLRALNQLESASNREIAEYLKIPVNCVTGRCKELRQRNLVIENGIKFDEITNRSVTVFKINI